MGGQDPRGNPELGERREAIGSQDSAGRWASFLQTLRGWSWLHGDRSWARPGVRRRPRGQGTLEVRAQRNGFCSRVFVEGPRTHTVSKDAMAALTDRHRARAVRQLTPEATPSSRVTDAETEVGAGGSSRPRQPAGARQDGRWWVSP